MTISEIDDYLRLRHTSLKPDVLEIIKRAKAEAKSKQDELIANTLWCYEEIFNIQKDYLGAYRTLSKAAASSNELIDNLDSEKSKLYENAWNKLDECDIEISYLERNFCISGSNTDDFHINEILDDIKKLRPLFPYKLFLSRESVVHEQKCSICGKKISVRHPCGHIPGKIYMGELCLREITDFEFLNFNVVEHPFDKYTIMKAQGKQFDFKLLDYIVPNIKPYCKWSYDIQKRLLPKYKGVGRNEKCPCGSGMKFKFCLRKNPERHYEDHYVFHVFS